MMEFEEIRIGMDSSDGEEDELELLEHGSSDYNRLTTLDLTYYVNVDDEAAPQLYLPTSDQSSLNETIVHNELLINQYQERLSQPEKVNQVNKSKSKKKRFLNQHFPSQNMLKKSSSSSSKANSKRNIKKNATRTENNLNFLLDERQNNLDFTAEPKFISPQKFSAIKSSNSNHITSINDCMSPPVLNDHLQTSAENVSSNIKNMPPVSEFDDNAKRSNIDMIGFRTDMSSVAEFDKELKKAVYNNDDFVKDRSSLSKHVRKHKRTIIDIPDIEKDTSSISEFDMELQRAVNNDGNLVKDQSAIPEYFNKPVKDMSSVSEFSIELNRTANNVDDLINDKSLELDNKPKRTIINIPSFVKGKTSFHDFDNEPESEVNNVDDFVKDKEFDTEPKSTIINVPGFVKELNNQTPLTELYSEQKETTGREVNYFKDQLTTPEINEQQNTTVINIASYLNDDDASNSSAKEDNDIDDDFQMDSDGLMIDETEGFDFIESSFVFNKSGEGCFSEKENVSQNFNNDSDEELEPIEENYLKEEEIKEEFDPSEEEDLNDEKSPMQIDDDNTFRISYVINELIEKSARKAKSEIQSIFLDIESDVKDYTIRSIRINKKRSKPIPTFMKILPNLKVTCPFPDCSFLMDYKTDSIKDHLSFHHITKETFSVCAYCGAWFELEIQLHEHVNIHAVEKDLICLTCEDLMPDSFTMATHLTCHENVELMLNMGKCGFCDYVLGKHNLTGNVRSNLQHHLNKCIKKKYSCKNCNLSFIAQSELRNHKVIHDGISPLLCPICLKLYSSSISMIRHMNEVHIYNSRKGKTRRVIKTIDQSNPFWPQISKQNKIEQCQFCLLYFSSKVGLKIHFTTAHQGSLLCDFCLKCNFKDFREFQEHKISHIRSNLSPLKSDLSDINTNVTKISISQVI